MDASHTTCVTRFEITNVGHIDVSVSGKLILDLAVLLLFVFLLFCTFAVFRFVICLFLGCILFITLFLLLHRFTLVAPASLILFLHFAVSNLLITRPGSLRLDLRQAGGGHRRHHQGLYHPPYRGTNQVTITLQHPTLSENRKYHMVIVLFAGIFCRISSMGWCLLPRWWWLKQKKEKEMSESQPNWKRNFYPRALHV